MWLKKTEQEIQNEKNNTKPSLVAPVVTLICVFFILTISNLTGFSKFQVSDKPKDLFELFFLLPEIIFKSIVAAIIIYLIQLYFPIDFFKRQETTVICDKCNKTKTEDDISKCICEGEFIKISKMKWTENKEN